MEKPNVDLFGDAVPEAVIGEKVRRTRSVVPKTTTTRKKVAKKVLTEQSLRPAAPGKPALDPLAKIVLENRLDFVEAQTDYAPMDQLHVMAPGLITSFPNTDRPINPPDTPQAEIKLGKPLYVRYQRQVTIDKVKTFEDIEIKGPSLLDGLDWKVLIGIVALAQTNGLELSRTTAHKGRQAARNIFEMQTEGDAQSETVILLEAFLRELAVEINFDVNNADRLRQCIERWFETTMYVTARVKGGKRQGYRLIDGYSSSNSPDSDLKQGQFRVILNPRLSRIILKLARQHIRIDMAELRQLQSDAAIICHTRLCSLINAMSEKVNYRTITMDTLLEYVYRDLSKIEGTVKKRRKAIRNGLQELSALGWIISEVNVRKGLWSIGRPPYGTAAEGTEGI